MNLCIKTFLSIHLLILPTDAPAQECKAVLNIISDINEVNIFINDSLAGSGRIFRTEIEPGRYLVRAVDNSGRWDSKSFLDTIGINDCSETILNFLFRNEILLNTSPQNVSIYNGDSLVGFTPLQLNPNFEKLLLRKADYLDREITLSDFKMNEKIKLDFTGGIHKESFYQSALFKILAGTAVALGVATAYFKLEADKKFDEYKITGDPDLLDRTDRLDIISAVTFTALQINFGLIFYFFLSD